MEKKKPICKLIGIDGNVFVLGGKVRSALKQAKLNEEAKEFSQKLTQCKSYEEALQLMSEYVKIK